MIKSFFSVLIVTVAFQANVFALDRNVALNAHNEVRAAVSKGGFGKQPIADPPLPNMMWHTTLANDSKEYAEQCVWQHSGDRINVGENLFATTNLMGGVDDAVSLWANEQQYFDFNSNSCEPGQQCGHYTQVVWYGSILVGCGEAVCTPLRNPDGSALFGSALFVVCRYATAGNIVDVKPYDTDGGDPSLIPRYDHSTRVLTVPYSLAWLPDNTVIPFKTTLLLVLGKTVQFQLKSLSFVDYNSRRHIPILDINSLQMVLPRVDIVLGKAVSQLSLVLKYVPGSSPPSFNLTHVE